jgi:nucleoside-diphosphate-sugar epimerase
MAYLAMRILVTGSSGHLGEGLFRVLLGTPHQAVNLDRLVSPFTTQIGSIPDREFVTRCLRGGDAVPSSASLYPGS